MKITEHKPLMKGDSMKPFKDQRTAEKQAYSRSRMYGNQGQPLFVVYEDGYYHVCTDEDIDTFFAGIRQEHIVYCTV